jgi:hypothetical protein
MIGPAINLERKGALMSTPEDKLVADAGKVKVDAAAVKAWYVSHQFYAGAIDGAILCGAAVHFLHL